MADCFIVLALEDIRCVGVVFFFFWCVCAVCLRCVCKSGVVCWCF